MDRHRLDVFPHLFHRLGLADAGNLALDISVTTRLSTTSTGVEERHEPSREGCRGGDGGAFFAGFEAVRVPCEDDYAIERGEVGVWVCAR